MSIRSEYNKLKQVVVHRPGEEWNLVTVEDNLSEKYLVEDVLFIEKAAADHKEFSDCLEYVSGENSVIQFADLLTDLLSEEEIRFELIKAVSAMESIDAKAQEKLLSKSISQVELTSILISGAFKKENANDSYEVIFPPVPNLLFTRDLCMFFGDSVILSHPIKQVRKREGLLAKFILLHHKLFSDVKIIDIMDDAKIQGISEGVHVEGGDLIALDSETLLIGTGERTTKLGMKLVAERLLNDGILKRVIHVELPEDRSTMHLDTVFTIVGKDDCVYFPPLFDETNSGKACTCNTYEFQNDKAIINQDLSSLGLFSLLEKIGHSFKNRIPCGGDLIHHQTREQWTDGANLFAVQPETAFIYERNVITIEHFQKLGYQILTPAEFLKADVSTPSKMLVTINGAELSRGRGGARCMTMPVSRLY